MQDLVAMGSFEVGDKIDLRVADRKDEANPILFERA